MNFDGKQKCKACDGNGRAPADPWVVCNTCDGIGRVWCKGGPMFDCTLELADRAPGDLVVLANGTRARVQFHIPRDEPETTFVTIFSDFDGAEDHTPKPCSSLLGVRVVEKSRPIGDRRQGVGEKYADLDDPLMRGRERGLV